jgi:hypothetical protein
LVAAIWLTQKGHGKILVFRAVNEHVFGRWEEIRIRSIRRSGMPKTPISVGDMAGKDQHVFAT